MSAMNRPRTSIAPRKPSSSHQQGVDEVGRLDGQEVELSFACRSSSPFRTIRRSRRRSGSGAADSPIPAGRPPGRGSSTAGLSGSRARMYVQAIGTAAMITAARTASQRSAGTRHEQHPGQVGGPSTSEVPRSGWRARAAQAGPIRTQAPRIVQMESEGLSAGSPGGSPGPRSSGSWPQLAELELEKRADGDPARRAADPVADQKGKHQEAEVHEVERPGEGAQPLVVEGSRDHEGDRRDPGPDEATRECGAELNSPSPAATVLLYAIA